MNKEELSVKLNELLMLEVEADFTKLTKEDLERVYSYLSLPKNLLEVLRRAARGRVTDDFMNMKIKDVLEPSQPEGGPLGLGLIPKVREKINLRRHHQQ